MKEKFKFQFILVLLSAILLLFGCSSSSSNTSDGQEENAAIRITDHANRDIAFSEVPTRVVSLVQGDMDIVHRLGAEIVGRPTVNSDLIREELKDVPEIGSAHEVDFEKIVSLRPDVVIGSASLNGKDAQTAESLGLKFVLTNSNSYDKIIDVIKMYGTLLDQEEKATKLIEEIESKKQEVVQESSSEVRVLIIYGTPEAFMAALPSSLAGNIVDIAGGENIASNLPSIDRYPDYAQLSMERIIEGDPDVIYFITHGDPEAVKEKFTKELQSNPSWKKMKAIENDRLIFLPYELFGTNPGTRIVESLQFMIESLSTISFEDSVRER